MTEANRYDGDGLVQPSQLRKLGLHAADLAKARPVYRHIARVL